MCSLTTPCDAYPAFAVRALTKWFVVAYRTLVLYNSYFYMIYLVSCIVANRLQRAPKAPL